MHRSQQAAMGEVQRIRLANWVDQQGVDSQAKAIFMNLPSKIREEVRSLGQLTKGRNPSALLLGRIKEKYPEYVVRDEQAHTNIQSGPTVQNSSSQGLPKEHAVPMNS